MARAHPKKRRPQTRRALAVEVVSLEIAAGHDGLLRGKPEPVLLVAALWVGATARTLGRAVVRFGPIGRYPCVAEPDRPTSISGRAPSDGRLVVLALALEEDTSTDVARVYGLLESVEPLSFWVSGADVPAPVPLSALPLAPRGAEPIALAVHVLEGARDLGDRCRGDALLGAWAAGVPDDGGTHELRLRFRSADGKNDWTARIHAHREGER